MEHYGTRLAPALRPTAAALIALYVFALFSGAHAAQLGCTLGQGAAVELQGASAGLTTFKSSEDSGKQGVLQGRRHLMQGSATAALGSFTSITIPLDVCGYTLTASNSQQLHDQVLGSGRSLKSYFDACSFGGLSMAAKDSENLVLSKAVPIRSSSVCNGNSVNCDINAVGDEALAYVRDVLNIDLSRYSIQNLIFPSNMPGCGLVGMGSWGCFTNDPGPGTPNLKCRTWLVSGWAAGLIHEVGHTLGLSHADVASRDDARDESCVMSNMGQFVCPNAYHSQLLGWTNALDQVNVANDISKGQWLTFQLPARVSAKTNYIQLTGAGDDLFVSYSAPVGWEAGSDVAYKLLVHKMSSAADWSRSQRAAMLGAGERWTQSNGGSSWVIQLGANPSNAQGIAHICRADSGSDCAPGTEPSGGGSQAALNNKKKKNSSKSGRKIRL